MNDPYKSLVLFCVDKAAAEYLAGRMDKVEAVNYGMRLVDEYAETEEFDDAIKEYFSKFVDVKDLKLGEKVGNKYEG